MKWIGAGPLATGCLIPPSCVFPVLVYQAILSVVIRNNVSAGIRGWEERSIEFEGFWVATRFERHIPECDY